MARALDLHSRGHRFDSDILHKVIRPIFIRTTAVVSYYFIEVTLGSRSLASGLYWFESKINYKEPDRVSTTGL